MLWWGFWGRPWFQEFYCSSVWLIVSTFSVPKYFSFSSFLLSVFVTITILLFWEFFTSTLADGFPLESEWQQFPSTLMDTTQYSGRSQQCCSLSGLHSSFYFQVLQSVLFLWLNRWTQAVELWYSSIQHLMRLTVDPTLNSFILLHINHATSHGF